MTDDNARSWDSIGADYKPRDRASDRSTVAKMANAAITTLITRAVVVVVLPATVAIGGWGVKATVDGILNEVRSISRSVDKLADKLDGTTAALQTSITETNKAVYDLRDDVTRIETKQNDEDSRKHPR